MCQRRPADPTDPGDAADLSIMGYFRGRRLSLPHPADPIFVKGTLAQEGWQINTFLTTAGESR
jgi:hypothetical protein